MGQSSKHGPTFNGGYYSTRGCRVPIPSLTKAYIHTVSRSRNLCCLPFLMYFIGGLIIIGRITTFFIWAFVHPTKQEFYVDGIYFSNSTSSSTKIALEISIWNVNKKSGIYYSTFSVTTFYGGQSIAFIELQDFYQGHKSTTILHPCFVPSVSFSSSNIGDLADIEVKL